MTNTAAPKDPFSILADEITLLRNDIKTLRRSSLDQHQADELHRNVVESLNIMAKFAKDLDDKFRHQLALTKEDIITQASLGARTAATEAIKANNAEIMKAARIYANNAAEARRDAWRYFGGFWVWLTTIALLGAILGAIGMFLLKGREVAEAFGQHPSFYCSSAGGHKGKLDNGREYCVFHLDKK